MPAKTEYKVQVVVKRQKIDVGFRAKEKFFDEDDNLLGERDLTGTWKGVTTFTADATVTETPLQRK